MLGVDGGGSKTCAWLGSVGSELSETPELSVLGKSTGGPSNVRASGFEAALANIKEVIANAFSSAGVSPVTAAHACISLAGAGRAEEQVRIIKWARQQSLADEVTVVGDADVVLAAAIPLEEWCQPLQGVSLIAGTGSMACGQNSAGERARSGGWGYLFGDEGSAYDVGRKALQLASRSADGRSAAGRFYHGLLDYLKLKSSEQLIDWCYGGQHARQRIASLAPFVFSIALEDEGAAGILESSADSLAQLVQAVVHQLGFQADAYLLACAGSVLVKQPAFVEAIVSKLESWGVPPAKYCSVPEPVLGALRVAAFETRGMG